MVMVSLEPKASVLHQEDPQSSDSGSVLVDSSDWRDVFWESFQTLGATDLDTT